MKRFTALWMYGIVFVTVLAVHAKAQNLLPFNWKVRFASGPVPGLPPPATDGYYPVNLLYSWERQGFSSIDGPGKLVCDFALPSGQISSGMALSIHLLCRIERVSINGKQLHGAIPATSWTGGPETKILIPDGFLKPGENRIEMDVSELGYTGGLSHNFCRLTFDKLTASVDPSVSIEVASANHIFVDTKPTARVHYHALRPGHLQVSIASDFHDKVYARSFSVAAGEGSIPMDLDSLAGKPGFYECTAMLDSGGFAGAVEWIGVSPERIECRSVTQKSTDSYWTEALNELHTVNGNFRIHKVAEWCTADREGYVVEMKSIGDVLITGYYFIPKSPGPHAAIMHVPGYGQRFRPTDFISNHDNVAELGLFVRGHEPNSPGRFEPPNGPTLWGYKIYDEHEYAYRGVYMDCVRGIEFLLSRPEIDPKRIGVMGGSQGGGLTLATAGLCGEKVAACAYWDPWPCDLRDHLQIRTLINSELQGFREYYKNEYSVARFQSVLDLVDTRNFGRAITCPVFFGTGLFDDDCPPHLGFSVYNLITTSKKYIVYPEGSHLENNTFDKDARAFFRKHFEY